MGKYLPHLTLFVQVILIVAADKYLGLSDKVVAQVRTVTG